MTTPTSRGAYGPYYDALDRALETKAGIRIECATRGDANQYRVRLHSARTLDRELNRDAREPSDKNYGSSDYDNLVVRVKPGPNGKWWVYIQPNAIIGNIEDLECIDGTSAQPSISPNGPSPASSAEKSVTRKPNLGPPFPIISKT